MSENLVGEFQLLNCIASGTTTQIWEASNPSIPENVVLKLMLPSAFEDKSNLQTLRHEAKVQAALDHPNIVVLHEFHAARNEAYLAMEYFRAPNVKTLIKVDFDGLHARFRRVVEGACLALDHMHSLGWVHKDVKPDNVLSNKAGEVKLIDFSLAVRVKSGLSKLLGRKSKTIQGTRTYIAPETILKKPATPATDVYSLGVMLYEILTGVAPFLGTSPNDLLKRHLAERPPEPSIRNPNVTDELDRVVVRMLAKKPLNRPQSMSEVFNELRTIPLFREEIVLGRNKEEDLEDHLGPGASLDSRMDAKRQAAGIAAPKREKPKPKPTPPPPKPVPPQPVAQSAPAAPPQPYPQQPYPPQGYPPQGYPPQGYPQGYPQQPFPGQPMPGQQFPGQPYPQQPYPGQPFPQQGYPPAGYPQQPLPGQPYPAQPGPQQPAPPQPAAPAPPPQNAPPPAAPPPAEPTPAAPSTQAPPVRRGATPPPMPTEDTRDLPEMTELPDIT